jgi:molybdopterin-containing oxidoreductase family membrane subunit
MALFLLVLLAAYHGSGRPVGDALLARLRNLLGVFIAGALLLVAIQHLTSLYAAEHQAAVRLLLVDGGVVSGVFWIGQVLLGSLLPLALIYLAPFRGSRPALVAACLLVVLGGLATMYFVIVGGQAVPLELFPGMAASSSFFDGQFHPYTPSFPELVLGLGGSALALLLVALGVRVLPFLPDALPDAT